MFILLRQLSGFANVLWACTCYMSVELVPCCSTDIDIVRESAPGLTFLDNKGRAVGVVLTISKLLSG